MSSQSHFFRIDKKFVVLFITIIALFGVFVLFRSQAAEQNPNAPAVYLTPTDITYGANQTFTVNVRVNSGSTPVVAAGAVFTYPTNLLEFQSISFTNSDFPLVGRQTDESGTIKIEASRAQNTGLVTGDKYLASVAFKTKATSGTANLNLTTASQLLNDQVVNIVGANNLYSANYTVDTAAPTTSITAPANNAVIGSGETVSITASATDTSAVSSVDILIDGSVKATLSSAPYNYSWNTNGVSLGAHTIQSRARDSYGNTGSSQIINVTVADKTAPNVTLTAPSNNAVLKGNATLSANASDNAGGTGLAKVEFYVQDTLVSTDTTSPYSVSWNSTSVTDGNYTVYAKAYDKASPANTKTTNQITVSVDNTDDEPPTAPGNFRSTSSALDSITLAWNASTDNAGVVGYRVSRNGSVIATVNTLTYTDTGLSNGTSYNYSVVAIDAAGNSSEPRNLSASTSNLKIGDFNKDDIVDLGDLALLLLQYGKVDDAIDLDNSGQVDLADLAIFIINYPKP
ncbi:hypothetical protein KC950_02495 [Candidatus Saccharibacteria bacterium]|nr:hypothetical protein [Candidatus Saccharibacteria bacterium]